MSLINKMLKDLEARQGGARGDRPIFQDLHAVRPASRSLRSLAWMVLASVTIAIGGYAGWQYWATDRAAAVAPPVVATAPAPETETVDAAAPVAAPPVAVPPAPVAAVPAPAPARPARAEPRKTVAASKPRAAPKPPVITAADTTTARIEKVDRPVTPQEQAANAYREALQLRGQGRGADAERLLRQALTHDPAHVACRQLLARTLIESGRQLEAQALLEQGIAAVPGESSFRIQLARLYVDQGAEPKAIALLERARTDNPGDVESTAFLAALYQRAGRHAEAVTTYEAALAQRPQEGRWWIGLGISREAQQQEREASDAYRRALASGQLGAQLAQYAEGRLQALGK